MMELFPPIPLVEWRDTKETLHRFVQIVGKIRLAASVRRNHWWNLPFHVTGRGITTRPMGQVGGNPIFTIDFDSQRDLVRRFGAQMQSTLIVYKGAAEVARSVGETQAEWIEQLLEKAL